ncbi:RidA family protein [Candidatus Saccharibacteria bacterium]|nr:RidA family protein [Candidatus Saccharibacteria bacterium]
MKTYGPYEAKRESGNLVFISGQVGVDPNSGSVASDIETQTRQTLENLQTALDGIPLKNVVKTTVYLKDMKDFIVVNSIYVEYFDQGPRPARACVAVADLPDIGNHPLLIEIEAIAFKGEN